YIDSYLSTTSVSGPSTASWIFPLSIIFTASSTFCRSASAADLPVSSRVSVMVLAGVAGACDAQPASRSGAASAAKMPKRCMDFPLLKCLASIPRPPGDPACGDWRHRLRRPRCQNALSAPPGECAVSTPSPATTEQPALRSDDSVAKQLFLGNILEEN